MPRVRHHLYDGITDWEFVAYTVLKSVKIHEFYHHFLQFVQIRKNSFLDIVMNAIMNLDFASFKFNLCLHELLNRHFGTYMY